MSMILEKFAYDYRACVDEALDTLAKERLTSAIGLGTLAILGLAVIIIAAIFSPSALLLTGLVAVLVIGAATFAVDSIASMHRIRRAQKDDDLLTLCETYLDATDTHDPLNVRPLTQVLYEHYGNLAWRVVDAREVIDAEHVSWQLWLACEDVEDAKNTIIEAPHPVAIGARFMPSKCLVVIDPITRRLDLNVPTSARWFSLDRDTTANRLG